MSIRWSFTALVLAGLFCNWSLAQQAGGGGGGGGGAPGGGGGTGGGGFGNTTFITPSTGFNTGSTSSQTSSSTSSGSNTSGTPGGAGGIGTTVISRPGFLSPVDRMGFLTPSNTNAIATSGRTGTAGGLTGISSRLGGLGGLGGGFGGLGGFGNQMGMNSATGTTGTQLRIPMRVVSSQSVSAPAQIAVATRFTQRVTKLPGLQTLDVTMTAVEGRTAVLRGKVASKEQAELIGRLALLEPGISSVRNELTVDPGLVDSQTLPAGE